MSEEWKNIKQIAEHLGLCTMTIHRLIRSKKIPAHKVGGQWRFLVSEVDAYIKEGKK
jgi:excisionase family DNA binding protein